MKNPENIPLDELESNASLADVITALNKIIAAVNQMWDEDLKT